MYSMWITMSANDFGDVLENITVPTYIVYGEKRVHYILKKQPEPMNSKILIQR